VIKLKDLVKLSSASFGYLPHQRRAAEALKNVHGIIMYHGLGAGKTLGSIAATEGIGAHVVTPASLRENYKKEISKAGPKSDFKVHSYESFSKNVPKDISDKALVLDECFPAGVKVLTNRGFINIENIENNEEITSVLSFNIETNKYEWKRIVRCMKNVLKGNFVRITHERRSIVCTATHKIWNGMEYKKAENFVCGERLLVLPKKISSETSWTETENEILQQILFREDELDKWGERRSKVGAENCDNESEGLSSLPEENTIFNQEQEIYRKEILQQDMFCGLEGGHAGREEKLKEGTGKFRHGDKGNEREKKSRTVKEDERKQSNLDAGSLRENIGSPKGKDVSVERRERTADEAAVDVDGGIELPTGMDGICNSNTRYEDSLQVCSKLLQGGHSEPDSQTSNRGGREFSQFKKMEVSGSQENRNIEFSRVVSVEVLKRESNEGSGYYNEGDQFVYNLEVEGNHNYFADGILVSNSQRVKTPGGVKHKAVSEAAAKAKKVVLLSGTPIQNKPHELAVMTNLVSGKHVLPESEKEFNEKFVEDHKVYKNIWSRLFNGAHTVEKRIKNKKTLEAALKGRVSYYQPEHSIADFPTVKEHEVRVEMHPRQAKFYNHVYDRLGHIQKYNIRHSLPPEKRDLSEMNAFMTQARQISNTTQHLDSKFEHSHAPKINRIADDMAKSDKSIAYSNFLGTGIAPLSRKLTEKGISHHIFTGEMGDRSKKKVVEDYNSGKVRALLVSSAGAEGLDLKGTRSVHIMEPHWHEPKIQQVVGRAARFKSHSHLPEDQRHVDVYHYASHLPDKWSIMGKVHSDPTADEYLQETGKKKQKLNDQFLNLMKDISIENQSKK
jgi:hypothetical protein